MDPRLLDYYNRELQFIRDGGAEFARQYPKIAGRLGLDGFECADPYVERLLEGFAYLAARVHLRIDAEFPRFTRHLMEMVYPHYLAPTPSMAVVQFQIDPTEGTLAEGFSLPRGSVLQSILGPGESTACEYRTAHDVTLWPIELVAADYFSHEAAPFPIPEELDVRAGVRLRLRATAGLTFNEIPLNKLPLFLRGGGVAPVNLYDQLATDCVAILIQPADQSAQQYVIRPAAVRQMGFDDDEALLPAQPRSFSGYRLLHEYFSFRERFLFVEINELAKPLANCECDEIELVLFFDREEQSLEGNVDKESFALYCAPAINLFPRRTDRVAISDRSSEFHVVVDRTRPMDFEICEVTGVTGFAKESNEEQEFRPFYAHHHQDGLRGAYYAVQRRPRILSQNQRERGARSTYVGSEIYLSLVDTNEAPYRHNLHQLGVETLCCNRDLPLLMSVGRGETDFVLESSAPVESVRCVAGPSKPKPSGAYKEGDTAWRLLSHLSLNYLSLTDTDQRQGAAGLRSLLKVYGDIGDPVVVKQIEGVRSVETRPIVRPVSTSGPMAFCRGLEITVTLDESLFEGSGAFLLGAVLDRFFSRYVSLNSFTQTVITGSERGELARWPIRSGTRHIL